jgi:hypothetical protein
MFPPQKQKVKLHVISLTDVVSVKEYERLQKKSKRQSIALLLTIGFITYTLKKDIFDLNKKDTNKLA